MGSLCRLIGAAFPALLAFTAAAHAESPPEPIALRLTYDGRLLIKVLDIQIDARADAQAFSAEARLNSYGVLNLFRRVDNRSSAQGRVAEAGGQPRAWPHVFRSRNVDAKGVRSVVVTWTGADVVTEAVPGYHGHLGDPPASRAQRLEAADPLTAMMRIALTRDEAELCRGSVRFFDGKQRYDLEFVDRRPGALNPHEKRLGLTRALRCQVRFHELAGFSRKPPDQRNQGLKKPVTLTFGRLGAEGPWLISAIEAETPLGHARVELQRVGQLYPGG
ncbi:MAG: DUF3108 domain-containing protein [Proteobacteria bacterium]|nr:DUF3108 domain-containing protein [Pseudomonadota bacterium]